MTEPSCRFPLPKDSSSSLAKSSREGAVAVAMDSPVCGAPGFEWRSKCTGRRSADHRDLRESRPALNIVLSERWFYQARVTQRLERGFVLQHEGWSATPSARSASLDDVDGGPDGRVYIQMRGIEQVRIRRPPSGRGRASFGAFV